MVNFDLKFVLKGTQDSFTLSVPSATTLDGLYVLLESEILIPAQSLSLETQNGRTLAPFLAHMTLEQLELSNDSTLTYRDSRFDPITPDEEQFISHLTIQDHKSVSTILSTRPELFRKALKMHSFLEDILPKHIRDGFKLEGEQFMEFFHNLTTDRDHRRKFYTNQLKKSPDSVKFKDALRKIEKEDAVDEAYYYAMEYSPESFTSVHMLYVNLEVNGVQIKAFVDSGAQSTIISPELAKRLDLYDMIDRRYAGKARGVGKGDILGTIHAVKVKLGDHFAMMTFSVLEGIGIDMLLGLDQLRRHQMCIDLKRNALIFEDSAIPFLSDTEIPKSDNGDGNPLSGNASDSTTTTSSSTSGATAATPSSSVSSASNTVTGTLGNTLESAVTFILGNINGMRPSLDAALRETQFLRLQRNRLQTGSSAPTASSSRPPAMLGNTTPSANPPATNANGQQQQPTPEQVQQVAQHMLQFLQQYQSQGGNGDTTPTSNLSSNSTTPSSPLPPPHAPGPSLGGAGDGASDMSGVNPQQFMQQMQALQQMMQSVKQEDVQRLMEFGYSEEDATEALLIAQGDLDMAASYLASKDADNMND